MKALLKRIAGRVTAGWRAVAARPGPAHLIRAWERFNDRLGNQFAAAITYFSFLSLVPIVMVAFAIAGFVLSSRPDLLATLNSAVATVVGDSFAGVIDQAVDQRLTVGIIGIAIALYSGLNWMGNIRDAVRAQWRPAWSRAKPAGRALVLQYVRDLATLAGLAVAVLVSFALTTVGTAAQDLVADWLRLDPGSAWRSLLGIWPFAAAITASTLVFAWVYTMVPARDQRAGTRTLLVGSFAMAVAFEVLKAALTLLLTRTASSPSGAVFGSVIGLLLFFNLVSRVFLMVAAWLATARRT